MAHDASSTPVAGQGTSDRRTWGESGWLLGGAVLLAFCLQLASWGGALQDDAFISMVYARNLARGAGLVYNLGEPPVEGYTNFLWTVLISLGMRLGIGPLVLVQALGMACAAGLLLATAAIARRLGASTWMSAAAALLLATRRCFNLEALGGLETLLFALWVALAVLPRLRSERRPRDELASGLALAAAALTRPEGVFVFGLLELWDLGRGPLRRGARGAALRSWLGAGLRRWLPFALIVGTHLAWRYATYGELVPNTFFAKVSRGAAQWGDGWTYVSLGILYFGPAFFLLPFAVALLRREPPASWVPCLVLAAAYPLYVIATGGDFKPTSRMLLPVMALWCALGAAAFERLGWRLGRGSPRGPLVAGVLFGLLLIQSGIQELLQNDSFPSRRVRVQRLTAVGRHLNQRLPEQAWIAVSNAGAIPYYADRRTIDMLGLNDAHIARLEVSQTAADMAGHRKGDGRYVLERGPEVILFLALEITPFPLEEHPQAMELLRQAAFGTSEIEILADPNLERRYRVVSHPLPGEMGHVNYLQRRRGGRGD